MTRQSCAVASALVGALILLAPDARAATRACKGILTFGDSMARAATLRVDVRNGRVRTPSCFKYPELAGFCEGPLRSAKDHWFVFGEIASVENSKIRAVLHRADFGGPVESAKVLFLGRCW